MYFRISFILVHFLAISNLHISSIFKKFNFMNKGSVSVKGGLFVMILTMRLCNFISGSKAL